MSELVSVITRTQNRPDFLREAIRSVANQSYSNIELVVVNDGGPNCEDLVREAAVGSIKRYRYEQLEQQIGRSHAANIGLDLSHGEFLIFLDDDDWFEKDHIAELMSVISVHPEVKVVYSGIKCVDENKTPLADRFTTAFDPIQLLAHNYIPIHAALFSRDIPEQGCRFNEALDIYEDWDFWIQASMLTDFLFVDSCSAIYRITSGAGFGVNFDQKIAEKASLIIFEKWFPRIKGEKLLQLTHVLRQLPQREQAIDKLNSQINALQQERATLKQELNSRQDQIMQIYNSHSWRITEPLRQIRRLLDKTAFSETGQRGYHILRTFWLILPIPFRIKSSCKNWLFRHFPWPFKYSKAYRDWLSFTGQARPVKTRPRSQPNGSTLPAYEKLYNTLLETAQRKPASDFVPLSKSDTDLSHSEVKLIAFYLPQFHPIAENDKEWGKGFTEWTNVSKAVPQFVGHYQPRLPGELGFYDLRLKEVQKRQIELAKQYGIHGFCYHHYWFNGHKVLDKPLQQVLADPSLDLPFCLCWANENWTRRWDGGEDEVILAQKHSPEDDLAFIKDIEPALRDSRYIRIDDKPLLIVYRPELLPDPKATAKRWREYSQNAGIGDLYIAAAATFGLEDYRQIDYDGLVQFPPHNIAPTEITDQVELLNENYRGRVLDYPSFADQAIQSLSGKTHTFPCVMMDWDNEARKPGRGDCFHHCSPQNYQRWLQAAYDFADNNAPEEKLVFINAWNEWAEGTYLEPDRRYGYAYLHATREVLKANINCSSDRKIVLVGHDALPHGAQYLLLHLAQTLSSDFGFDVALVLLGKGLLKTEYQRWATVHDLSDVAHDGEAAETLARQLYAQGYRAALVNSTVSGLFLQTLTDSGLRCVALIHELPGIIESYGLHKQAKAIAAKAAAVVFPASQVADSFLERTSIPEQRLHIRPQGLYKHNAYRNRNNQARQLLRSELGLAETDKIVLGVGYADYRKGVDLFTEIGLQVAARHSDIYFVWLGHWDPDMETQIQQRLRDEPLADRFMFPGRRDDTDLFYAGADVFALTSREDPFPSVVMESLNVSVPVIGFSDIGGSENLLKQGCGLLVEKENSSQFASAINDLLENKNKANALGAKGAELIQTSFSFRHYLFDLLDMAGLSLKRVSVVVPNYNYAHYLKQRLDSILAQTYPLFELIVLDDASTDSSLAVVEQCLASSNVDVRLIKNRQNSGSVFKQWQKAVETARGDFIWIAEADDNAESVFLEKSIALFDDEQVVMSYTQSRQIDESDEELNPNYLEYTDDVDTQKWRQDYIRDGKDELAEALAVKNTIPNVSAAVFRKTALNHAFAACQDVLPRLNIAGDWLIYSELLKQGKIGYVADALNLHRRHRHSVTVSSSSFARHLAEIIYMQNRVADSVKVDKSIHNKAELYVNKIYRQFKLDDDGIQSAAEHDQVQQALLTIQQQD